MSSREPFIATVNCPDQKKIKTDIHQVLIKCHNFLVYRNSKKKKEKDPVNTTNTIPNKFSISFSVCPHLPLVSWGLSYLKSMILKKLHFNDTYQIKTTRYPNYKVHSG